MFTFDELERHAYIKGEPELATLYARIAELQEYEEQEEERLKQAFNDGFASGSDSDLLQRIELLEGSNEALKSKLSLICNEVIVFLNWLGTDQASTKKARNLAVQGMFRKLAYIRSSK